MAPATTDCKDCTEPRSDWTYNCPKVDADGAAYDGCHWILQKKNNGFMSKDWSAGRSISFECKKGINDELDHARRDNMRGLKVSYTADDGKYAFTGFLPLDGQIKVAGDVVTVPILEKLAGHHEGDLQLKVLATRKGHEKFANGFPQWLSNLIVLCTGDAKRGGIALSPEAAAAAAAAIKRRDRWMEMYNDAARIAKDAKNGERLHSRRSFYDAYFCPTCVSVRCSKIQQGANGELQFFTADQLVRKHNQLEYEEVHDIYVQQFKAPIPDSASTTDIANYITDMLQFPEDGIRQDRTAVVSSTYFFSWLDNNGCTR